MVSPIEMNGNELEVNRDSHDLVISGSTTPTGTAQTISTPETSIGPSWNSPKLITYSPASEVRNSPSITRTTPFTPETTETPEITAHDSSQSPDTQSQGLLIRVPPDSSPAITCEPGESVDSLAPPRGSRAQARVKKARKSRPREVTELLKIVEAAQEENYQGPKTKKVKPSHYWAFLDAVEDTSLSGFFKDGFRYDYTHEKSQFVIRMATDFHETFLAAIKKAIRDWISGIQKGSIVSNTATRTMIESLEDAGNPRIPSISKYPKGINTKSPDGVFLHRNCTFPCAYPPLVIEVIWSNRPWSMKEYATQYIDKNQGQIRTFVGVDMHKFYLKQKKATATVSVWRARKNGETGEIDIVAEDDDDEQVFRNKSEGAIQSKGIQLSLKDFLCNDLLSTANVQNGFRDLTLSIDSDKLNGFFEAAEKAQDNSDKLIASLNAQMQAPKVQTPPKRRRDELKSLGGIVDLVNHGRAEVKSGIYKGLKRSLRLKA